MFIVIDKAEKRTYARQIYTEIRKKILSGELRADEPLPSSRELSRDLSVARNTVLTAYDLLVSEGAVRSVERSGFVVCGDAVHRQRTVPLQDRQTASLSDTVLDRGVINFDSGIPALEMFPREKWNRAMSRAFLDAPVSALGYDDPQGRSEFRQALCTYLKRTRGISCSPDRIIVTSGAKQGISLAAKCLLDENSEVWMEDPSNVNVKQIFSYHTERIVPFAVDEQGIRPELFPEGGRPALVFTTPSHQFPMGGILSIQRRIALADFARRSGACLLEDDYDSAFSYDAAPANSLFELESEHVIYVGTFSKVLFPSVRLGYLVVPTCLVPRMRELKRLADHHSGSVTQLAMLRFMESGDLDRHIRHMRREYGKRRDLLLGLLERRFGDRVRIHGAGAGMHIVAEFEGVDFSEERIRRLLDAGVYLVPVQRHSQLAGEHGAQVILGYSGLDRNRLSRGLEIIQDEIEKPDVGSGYPAQHSAAPEDRPCPA